MTNDDEKFQSRVQALLADSVARLDPADRDERIAYCREHNEHGVRMHPSTDDDLLEFRWGGKQLALVHRDVLLDEGPFRAEFIADDVPDALPGDWDDQREGGGSPS
jgi:hypothetical protein